MKIDSRDENSTVFNFFFQKKNVFCSLLERRGPLASLLVELEHRAGPRTSLNELGFATVGAEAVRLLLVDDNCARKSREDEYRRQISIGEQT